MKLRMETGNFNIVLDESNEAYLPKGLSKYDLIGVVVENSEGYVMVATVANEGDTGIHVTFGNLEFTYDPDTGLLTGGGVG